MKINTSTPTGLGQFLRLLRKLNRANDNMRRAHSGMYNDRYCNRRRLKKWNRVRAKWDGIQVISVNDQADL